MYKQQIWKIKPQFQSLSVIKHIDQFKKQIDNKQLKQVLTNLQYEYPSYRTIRGDGNCFYRSVAFSYIKQKNLSDFPSLFFELSNLDLTVCKFQQIPECFHNVYDDKLLKHILKNGWQQYFINKTYKNQAHKEEQFRKVINKYYVIDFIIILYFRSLNFKTLSEKRKLYQNFTQNTIQKQLQGIATYGRQSEGIQLDCMAQALNAEILVLMVTKKGINPLNLSSRNPKIKIFLFFMPGHYNIIYNNKDHLEQDKYQTQFIPRPQTGFKKKEVQKRIPLAQKNIKTQQSEESSHNKVKFRRKSQTLSKKQQSKLSNDSQNKKTFNSDVPVKTSLSTKEGGTHLKLQKNIENQNQKNKKNGPKVIQTFDNRIRKHHSEETPKPNFNSKNSKHRIKTKIWITLIIIIIIGTIGYKIYWNNRKNKGLWKWRQQQYRYIQKKKK